MVPVIPRARARGNRLAALAGIGAGRRGLDLQKQKNAHTGALPKVPSGTGIAKCLNLNIYLAALGRRIAGVRSLLGGRRSGTVDDDIDAAPLLRQLLAGPLLFRFGFLFQRRGSLLSAFADFLKRFLKHFSLHNRYLEGSEADVCRDR
jgi:hypothetical protein